MNILLSSRMESTGEPNCIQVSGSTADLLKEAGKSYWIKPREDLVHAKGKGNVQTFWIMSRSGTVYNREAQNGREAHEHSRTSLVRTRSMLCTQPVRGVKRTCSDTVPTLNVALSAMTNLASHSIDLTDYQKEERLVQWQVEMFTRLLKRIVAARVQNRGQHQIEGDFEQNLVEDDEISFVPLNDVSASEYIVFG